MVSYKSDFAKVSLSHVFFNVFGFTLFFLIPITRRPVIKGSNWIGKMAGRYRWWSIMYTILAFILLPILLFVISIFPKNYIDDNGNVVTGNGHITSLGKKNQFLLFLISSYYVLDCFWLQFRCNDHLVPTKVSRLLA